MRLGSFTYLLKQGTKNAYLNKAMSFASVGVLTACLVLVGMAALFAQNINNIVGFIQQQNEIVVYLEDDISAADETNLDKQLRSMQNVLSVEYISKEQAFEDQKEKLGDLLDGYENEDVFPASYSVKVKDLSLIEEDIQNISQITGVYRVDAPTDIAEIMVKTRRAVTLGGTIVVIALLIVSLVIIINTIKITVFSRRKEINIMKFVGATNGFIRMPFLFEGMILGAIAAVVSFLIVWYLYVQIYNSINIEMTGWLVSVSETLIPFNRFGLGLFATYLLLGVAVGSVGSVMSVRKHLKV